MISYRQLYHCYLRCRRNKRNTLNQLAFEVNAEQNLLRLQEELNNRTYHPGPSICFVVEKPKLREVFAADFRDRVVHHVLVEYLEAICEPRFIYDSYACRPEKGTHAAVKRLQHFTRSITRNNSQRAYYMQLDIRSFFVEINKNILRNIVRKHTQDGFMVWLADVVISNDCTQNCRTTRGKNLLERVPPHKSLFKQVQHRGLPIGNLTSQFFANLYLNELDQFVKRQMRCHYYVRYTDDMVLLSTSQEELRGWMAEIEQFLARQLDLELHPNKRIIRPISNGIDFLGYIIRPFYLLVRRRVVGNVKHKIRTHRIDGQVWASYKGHFKHAQTHKLEQSLCAILEREGLAGILQ